MRLSKLSTKAILVFVIVAMLALAVGAVGAQDDGNGNGNGPRRTGDNDRNGLRDLIAVVVEQTGLTAEEIVTQVRDGVTLADIITENGGSVDVVVDAILTNAETRLSEAVANERITQEQMDERLATITERVTSALNGEFEPRNGGFGGQGSRGDNVRNLIQNVIDATGLDAEEFIQQVRDGATPAEVIEANGGDVDAVVATILVSISDRINEQVDAGELDAERGAEILINLEQRVTDFMNGIRPERGNPPVAQPETDA